MRCDARVWTLHQFYNTMFGVVSLLEILSQVVALMSVVGCCWLSLSLSRLGLTLPPTYTVLLSVNKRVCVRVCVRSPPMPCMRRATWCWVVQRVADVSRNDNVSMDLSRTRSRCAQRMEHTTQHTMGTRTCHITINILYIDFSGAEAVTYLGVRTT